MAIRIFIVDDHPVVREGLKLLAGATSDLQVVGEAASVADALVGIQATAADVVVLDMRLGGEEDGLRLIPAVAASVPSAKVLVLTGVLDRQRHQQALLQGARGLVLKDRPPELLLKAIRLVHAGELWFEHSLVDATIHGALAGHATDPVHRRIAALTAREREIIALLAGGRRNAEVARTLGLAEKTVRNALSIIFEKLAVTDRLELLVFAYRHGLVPPPG